MVLINYYKTYSPPLNLRPYTSLLNNYLKVYIRCLPFTPLIP
jgi:hypothetical protein